MNLPVEVGPMNSSSSSNDDEAEEIKAILRYTSGGTVATAATLMLESTPSPSEHSEVFDDPAATKVEESDKPETAMECSGAEALSVEDLGYNQYNCHQAPQPPEDFPKCPAIGKRTVHFGHVQIREYSITIGDNPYCSQGVPISLDWDYLEQQPAPIDLFESQSKRKRRQRHGQKSILLNSIQRRDLLWRCGHDLDDIERAAKANEKEKFRQSLNFYCMPLFVLQEFFISTTHTLRQRPNAWERNREYEKVRNEEQVRQLHLQQFASVDPEMGGLTPWQQDADQFLRQRPGRRISFRGSLGLAEWQLSSGPGDMDTSSVRSNDTAASVGDNHYGIRTDPRQHDKATEIILCSLQRPHMRAFHASWFGFFMCFVMWFAITPLLGEVKDTLHLTNQQIWTSSLCGTAVTVVFRILMGPLCDVFGARKVMAAIVVVSAVPCACTGLVQTAAGLCAIRAFVGIAGSSFVPCQYWTSRMFAREVAGSANAIVAGWGNLGGGIAQLLMGSVLFPLFQVIFSGQDEGDDESRSSELSWRVVFVIPAAISLLTGFFSIYCCDDSPKGDFTELVRQQQIEIVSPFWCLGLAIQNRNVILLLIQYACCFGVEITMTNATALYFKEEFGQDTASAAAIASVFGIMNLFARGLGGIGSDWCQARYGTKGRVVWQFLTLFFQGSSIVLFAFTESLLWAIVGLIFLSLWVQCAEGATFGIVPYVNRRFTGAVVGWIGAGGTMGGVVFAVLFRELDNYKRSFVAMGAAAAASAFLSIFMNLKSLAAIYQEKIRAEHIKNNHNFVFHDDAPARKDH